MNMHSVCVVGMHALLLLLVTPRDAFAFSLPGIWKLSLSDFSILRPVSALDRLRDQLVTDFYEQGGGVDESLLIKLNPDGTFRQCTEGFQEGRWISGRWRLQADDNKILFALDRQYYGPANDVLLEANYSRYTRTTVKGRVYVGTFMYPKQHPNFFQEPILISRRNETGLFSLEQTVATTSITQEPEKREPRYPISTFYNRTFYLVVSPIESRQQLENQPFDLRAMRIHFHANHTFQAFGYNKILRGRYGLRRELSRPGPTGETIWFQVSLFGAGRSAPGSVYSEGIGLQKDDEQSYVGTIDTTDDDTLVIQGSTMVGSDLGSYARPEPVGNFRMMEITEHDDET